MSREAFLWLNILAPLAVRFCRNRATWDGLFHKTNSVLLVAPVEDVHVALGHAEAMDVFQGGRSIFSIGSAVPVYLALS